MIPCQRDQFDIPDDVAYFNCAYTSPLMKNAFQAGETALKQKSAPWTLTPNDFFKNLEENRGLFARLINGNRENVAIIPAASYGIALATKNLPIRNSRTIVVLEDQFPSNIYSWQRAAANKGAKLVTVRRPSNRNWTPAVIEAINAQTAVAALPNCHWTDGTVIDLVAVGKRCREVDAALVVDGTQSLGALPFSIEDIQPDFLVTAAHKWLLGPYSFGFCYVAPRWQSGEPLEENWLNREGSENFSRLVDYVEGYQPGARRYDVGGASNFILAPVAAAALKQILEWGVDNIADTLGSVTGRIAERAQTMGLEVAPLNVRGPHMVGLHSPEALPPDLPATLERRKVYVSVRGNAIRVAAHLYNTEADIDRLFSALAECMG